MENINGYFNGLSSPSGTLKIMALFTAPVSNSAGQTRLPTFSRMARSTSFVPRLSIPCLVISASRWHMPPVWIWIAFAPVCAIVSASTSESMSASMTPMRISSFNAPIVRTSVVVFPDPGEDIRFRRNVLSAFNSERSTSASLSLSSRMFFLISITLNSLIRMPLSLWRGIPLLGRALVIPHVCLNFNTLFL